MTPPGGLIIGEFVAIVSVGAMLVESGPESNVTRAIVMLQGLLVIAGVDMMLHGGLGLGDFDGVFRVANIFEFCLLGVGVGMAAAQTWLRALKDLVMPFLVCGVVTGTSLLGGGEVDAELWWRAVSYLGLYYYVVSGGFILALLLEPPDHAAAGELTLSERFLSGFGLFFIALQLIWWTQLYFVLAQRGAQIFTGSALHVGVGVAALLFGVVGSIRRGMSKL